MGTTLHADAVNLAVAGRPNSAKYAPYLLLVLLVDLCRILSLPFALGQLFAARIGILRFGSSIANSVRNPRSFLVDVWANRFVRELLAGVLRTPLRSAAVALVSNEVCVLANAGCVIAVCHSPWLRLLDAWCGNLDYAITLAGGRWAWQANGVNVAGGFRRVRYLVRHLKSGGRVIVIGDVFVRAGGCRTTFLGVGRQASPLPARLAAAAGVPLQAAVAVRRGHRIAIEPGPLFAAGYIRTEKAAAMRTLLVWYEGRILQRPALWSRIFKQPHEG